MMDLTTALIGGILIALCVLPMVYFHRAQQKEKRDFIKEFQQIAAQHGLTISQWDVWGHFLAIGLDTSTNQLFFYGKRNERMIKTLIRLAEVEQCSCVNKKITFNGDQVIDRLELAFVHRHSSIPAQTLMFYHRETSLSLNDELQLTEKWKTIINGQLENRRKLAVAS
jgi:hypothetical protein